jgi:predicted site-specific integrase-resolvase
MSKYVPPRIAIQRLGVCSKTLERWEKEEKIKTYRTPSGQRRYDCDSVVNIPSTKRTILYAELAAEIKKQTFQDRLSFFCLVPKRRNYPRHRERVLNFKRKGLVTLLELIYTGDIGMVVVASKDRLCRFGFDHISWFAERAGVKFLFSTIQHLVQKRNG